MPLAARVGGIVGERLRGDGSGCKVDGIDGLSGSTIMAAAVPGKDQRSWAPFVPAMTLVSDSCVSSDSGLLIKKENQRGD